MLNRMGLYKFIFGQKNPVEPTCAFASQLPSVYHFVSNVISDIFYASRHIKLPEGQTIISTKLAEYLKLTAPESDQKLQKKLRDGGYCYALSISHGAMTIAGKQKWWEKSLFAIAKWDQTQESLDKEIILPGSEDKNPVKLHTIFTRVLNYIVFYQKKAPDFCPKDMRGTAYIEIVTAKKILKITKAYTVAGFLSQEKLVSFLNEKRMQNSYCMVESTRHAIRIGYQKDLWMIYDPNYIHNTCLPLHKLMKKQAVAAEIIRILGNSLVLKICYFGKSNTRNFFNLKFDKYLRHNAIELFQEYGLHLIAHERSELIPKIFDRAEKDEKYAHAVEQAIIKQIPTLIIDGKTTQCVESIVESIARHCPNDLNKIYEFAKKSKNSNILLRHFFQDLTKTNINGLTKLHYLDQKLCSNLLDKYNEFKEGPNIFSQCLISSYNEEKTSGLYHFYVEQNKNFEKILNLAAADQTNGYKNIIEALAMQATDSKKSNFTLISETNTSMIINIVNRALKDKTNPLPKSTRALELFNYLFSALWLTSCIACSRNHDNPSDLHYYLNWLAVLVTIVSCGNLLEINDFKKMYRNVNTEVISLLESKQTFFAKKLIYPLAPQNNMSVTSKMDRPIDDMQEIPTNSPSALKRMPQ